MEQLGERLSATRRALDTLAEALGMPFSVVVRDAAVQRFEYSFESLWKLLQAYLYEASVVSRFTFHAMISQSAI